MDGDKEGGMVRGIGRAIEGDNERGDRRDGWTEREGGRDGGGKERGGK